jgi:hypothetical protein
MFGKDLEKFIKENINFSSPGFNEDIYFNIKDEKFWIHSYFGNESLSPDSDQENILIFCINNNFEWDTWNGCECCENNNTNECPYKECMTESLYAYISDNDYIEDNIRDQILDKVSPDIDDFVELDLKLTELFGPHHEYINKCFNSSLSIDIQDEIIDGIIDNGFCHKENDNAYLDGNIDHLLMRYVDYADPEDEIDEDLLKMAELLRKYKIKEALNIFK